MHTPEQKQAEASAQLKVAIASATTAGVKAINEDALACQQAGSLHQLTNKGICLTIADGVSSAEAGREASLTCTQEFIQEYYKTPDTWSVKHAGQKTLTSINLKLYKKSHEFVQQEKGYLCTFNGLVFKSQQAHFFHVGDSRIYLLRDNALEVLTKDHTVALGGGKNILARAVGMDSSLHIDYENLPLQTGDLFLLSTDGIHDFISPDLIRQLLSGSGSLEQRCQQLIDKALELGSDDNISCVLALVEQLPEQNLDDFNNQLTRLPFPPELAPGMKLDGYIIEQEIFASSRSQVYLVTDPDTNQQLIMKTPSSNFSDDTHYIDRFIQEEWIGKRIDSPYVVKVINQSRQRNFLYYLMEYVPGISLQSWMSQNPLPAPKTAIAIIRQIAAALEAFHKAETIHQDLKPANILVDKNQQVKVIDFGSVYVAGIAEIFTPIEHSGALGTASYSDPHYLRGKNTGVQGDIYSLASITYELFCAQLPYGEAIENCTHAYDYDKLRYQSAREYNPVIPVWFDRTLEKGVSFDLTMRYQSLGLFLQDLTHPNPEFLRDDPQLQQSKGLLFWQLMSAFWIFMLIIVVLVFSST